MNQEERSVTEVDSHSPYFYFPKEMRYNLNLFTNNAFHYLVGLSAGGGGMSLSLSLYLYLSLPLSL